MSGGRLSFRETPVRVQVPATSANLGPGFDSFGLALAMYDELEVRVTPSGLTVDVTGEGARRVRRDESNLVVRALRTTLDRLGGQPSGLALRCTNLIPHGRGLGSSAAAIVAGVYAARSLVHNGNELLDDQALLELATAQEGHPDNVAACLNGGLTLAWTGAAGTSTEPADNGVRAVRLEPAGMDVVAFVPSRRLSTEAARGLLPDVVPHADAAANAARAGLLVAALTGAAHTPTPQTGTDATRTRSTASARRSDVDLALLLAATRDLLHQPYRASAMPASAVLVRDLRAGGHPAVISGAGPTVVAFAQVGGGERLVEEAPDGFVGYVLAVDHDGARMIPG